MTGTWTARRRRETSAALMPSSSPHVLRGTGKPPVVGLGPVVWDIKPGSDTRQVVNFTVASVGAKDDLRIDAFRVAADEKPLADHFRGVMMMELIRRKPIVLHDFDDELRMAFRLFEALCPRRESPRHPRRCRTRTNSGVANMNQPPLFDDTDAVSETGHRLERRANEAWARENDALAAALAQAAGLYAVAAALVAAVEAIAELDLKPDLPA